MILSESKRDDLLLPYIEMLRAKGINCTLGQLKSYMLKKLTNEARMRNLSLGSNFYLAGAVRYYFNGDLTLNKDLDVYNNGQTKNDVWNEDVCQKLNALINILRNAYIDTIGETFEQPEDFGTLTLPKLLRKYGKKIQKELEDNSGTEIDSNNEDDGLDRNDRVGRNYSYEIIYNYKQATKYNQYTDPGAWCITYAKPHYDHYIKMLNIHYVIFKQDGFENVKREFGPDWTPQKPQDEYGCSLIAVLQSNKNGEPIYITSRWNHGYEKHCEADHAFTKEEFFAKTGVNDDDLQRIFTIWKKDAPKYSDDTYATEKDSVSKEEKLNVLRKLKYTQMKINGGDMDISDTIKILTNLNGEQEGIDEGKIKITKNTLWCRTVFPSNHVFYFIMDKGKIVFETLTPDSLIMRCYSSNIINKNADYIRIRGYSNLSVIKTKRYIMLYDLRRHCIIDIDGETKFKCIPFSQNDDVNNKCFYEVRCGKQQLALLNAATNLPLRLPNGSCWINKIRSNVAKGFSIIGNSNLEAFKHFGGNGGGILELIYDASSGERYFYDIDKKLFLNEDDIPKPEDPSKTYVLCTNFKMPGAMAFYVASKTQQSYYIGGSPIKVLINGQFLKINGSDLFDEVRYAGDDFIIFSPYNGEMHSYWQLKKILYDLKSKTEVINPITNEVLKFQRYPEVSYDCDLDDSRFLFIEIQEEYASFRTLESFRQYGEFIFDKQTRGFIKNPCGFPGEYLFGVVQRGNRDGSDIVIIANNNASDEWRLRQQFAAGDTDDMIRNFRVLDVPGVDNSPHYPKGSYYEYLDYIPRVSANGTAQEYSMGDIQQMVREAVNKILNKQL